MKDIMMESDIGCIVTLKTFEPKLSFYCDNAELFQINFFNMTTSLSDLRLKVKKDSREHGNILQEHTYLIKKCPVS